MYHVKGVGNKRRNASKLPFLRYSTGESGMIVELFSHRPFIEILFSRFKIWVSRFRITDHFQEISAKFPGNFPEISRKIPTPPPTPLTHPPCHSPTPNTPNCEPTQNFTFTFLKYTIYLYFHVYFPHPSCTGFCTQDDFYYLI